MPEQALDISKALGAVPNGTALIGDSLVDLMTAKNSGFKAFLSEWGGHCDIPEDTAYPYKTLQAPNSILDHAQPI